MSLQGLVETFKQLMPTADHRFCVRHMYANFNIMFKGKDLKDLMWSAARAYTVAGWEENMNKIKGKNADAYEWLMRESPSVWCRSMFSPRAKSDMLANNVSESFNHYIREARDKPIITMLEMIRRQLMSRYEEKRSWILTCNGTLCPKIQKIIEEMKVEARNCEVAYAGNHIYEVWHGVRTLVVDLANHTCVCRKWDVTGIPCAHAVAAIMSAKRQPESYVNECYNRDSYMRAYAPIIHPIPDQTEWVHTEFDPIVPPPLRRPPGRPKKARRRGPDEPNNPHLAKRTHQSLRCSNCQELGHNTRTCKGPVAPKKGMGRGTTRGRGTTMGSTSQSSGITIGNSRPIAGMTSIMVRILLQCKYESWSYFYLPYY